MGILRKNELGRLWTLITERGGVRPLVPKMKIVSGCDHLRFYSFLNHQIFSEKQGCAYEWKYAPPVSGQNPYMKKLSIVESELGSAEWLFWLDDDAFFTDFTWDICSYIDQFNSYDLVICKSPVNEGRWTHISSGQFFLRSSPRSFDFLKQTQKVSLGAVKEWWSDKKYGLFTGGDQDAMVYVLNTNTNFSEGNFYTRLDYSEFNSREFHYTSSASEGRILHLASNELSKSELLERYCRRFAVNNYCVPNEYLPELPGLKDRD